MEVITDREVIVDVEVTCVIVKQLSTATLCWAMLDAWYTTLFQFHNRGYCPSF
jgi:hypothetical protein